MFRRDVEDQLMLSLTDSDYKTINEVSDDLKPFEDVSKSVFEAVSKMSKDKPSRYLQSIESITDLYGAYAYMYKKLKIVESGLQVLCEKGACKECDSAYEYESGYKKDCCKEEKD